LPRECDGGDFTCARNCQGRRRGNSYGFAGDCDGYGLRDSLRFAGYGNSLRNTLSRDCYRRGLRGTFGDGDVRCDRGSGASGRQECVRWRSLATDAGTKPGLAAFVVAAVVGCAAAVSVLGATVAVLAALAREVERRTAASIVANSEGADNGERS
jgi:hypothetical protein